MDVVRSALVIPVLRHAGEDLRDLNLVAADVEMLMSHATLQFGAFRTMTQIYRISRCKSEGFFHFGGEWHRMVCGDCGDSADSLSCPLIDDVV